MNKKFFFTFQKYDVHSRIACIGIFMLVLWYIFAYFAGERVWVNGGAGWDGNIYAGYAKSFSHTFFNKKISEYYLQHILPSALLHTLAKIFHVSLDSTKEIVRGFLIVQYLMLIGVAVYIAKIAKFFAFSRQVKFMYFAAIFLTVPVLKKFIYLPIGTDITALFIGTAAFYYYIKRKYILLFIVSFFGAFVYPSLIYVGFILLLIPQLKVKPTYSKNKLFAILKIFIVLGYVFFAYQISQSGFRSGNASQQLHHQLLYISLFAIALYGYNLLRPISGTYRFYDFSYAKLWKHIGLGITFFAAVKFVLFYFASTAKAGITISHFFDSILYGSIVNPFVSLVCHISYYGPIIFFLLFFWKYIYKQLVQLNLPMILVGALYLFLTLGRESRQFINALPLFVTIICMYCNKYTFSWRFVYMFIIMSLVFSKVWFQINEGDMSHVKGLLIYPAQRFFMMNGAWMSITTYYIHLCAEIIMVTVFYLFLRKEDIYKDSWIFKKLKK
ncbi:MAG: hypothetical protein PF481_05445 [Bacteroidales bacterium]|nr:hypothetical protein [Bacteroidales bacterium]